MTILTTSKINVKLEEGQRKFKRTTTKTVDASIKVEQPKVPTKPQSISTRDIMDVGDAIEKKKRVDIIAQRKAYLVDKNGGGLKKLNRQFIFIDILGTEEGFANEDEIQAFPRRELSE